LILCTTNLDQIYEGLCNELGKNLKPRYASVRTLYDPSDITNVLDSQAVVIKLPAPRTQTGEDMVEFHVHGGNATVKAVLEGIARIQSRHKIRYAEAGEFTRRGFANGKLDLSQVEALSNQLSAETEQQRRAAVKGSSKYLGTLYESWRKSLLDARGEMEALIDFSEDQHFDESPAELLSGISEKVRAMKKSIVQHEDASTRGELLRRGIRISLLGAPNAGKSSLLNQIVGREASIVSQEPGTTRDVVEVSLDIRGYLCTFADTAGLRTEENATSSGVQATEYKISSIEQEGIRRAKAKASESDLVIALASVEHSASSGEFELMYDPEALSLAAAAPNSVIVINKWDLVPAEKEEQLVSAFKIRTETLTGPSTRIVMISCREAESTKGERGGIDNLVEVLATSFQEMTELRPDLQDLLGVTERSRQLLVKTSESLEAYLHEASDEGNEPDIVIAAEHLRDAAQSLARITGKTVSDVEEVLGVVFEK
jgi:tRNA modification GTPase